MNNKSLNNIVDFNKSTAGKAHRDKVKDGFDDNIHLDRILKVIEREHEREEIQEIVSRFQPQRYSDEFTGHDY